MSLNYNGKIAKFLRQIIRGPLEFMRIAGYHPIIITYRMVVTFNILFVLLQCDFINTKSIRDNT